MCEIRKNQTITHFLRSCTTFQEKLNLSANFVKPPLCNDKNFASFRRSFKMLSRQIFRTIPKEIRRNYGVTAPAMAQASDPIQQLFIDKIREYKSKSA